MRWVLAVLMGVCLTGMGARGEEIRVAAAISLKEAATDAAKAFQTATGDSVQFNFGSSGAMVAQIKSGAPDDAFISAADKEMDALQKDQLIDPATRRVVATNEMVIVVPADAKNLPAVFSALRDPPYKRIAVGEPRTVPAGAYAVEVLKHLKLFDALAPRLVYGANVRQVLVYVERGEVDAGIVYSTDAKEAGNDVKVAAQAKPEDHGPIHYPGAVIAASAHKKAALAFLDFLGTPAGRKILSAHGFMLPASPAPSTQP